MILRDTLLRRNVAEYSALLLVIASHVYKDDSNSLCVTAEFAFFRILLGRESTSETCKEMAEIANSRL